MAFTNQSVDALDLLPPVLRASVVRTLLQTSFIQVRRLRHRNLGR